MSDSKYHLLRIVSNGETTISVEFTLDRPGTLGPDDAEAFFKRLSLDVGLEIINRLDRRRAEAQRFDREMGL